MNVAPAPHASALVVVGMASLSLVMLGVWPWLLWRAASGQDDRVRLTAGCAAILLGWAGLWWGLAQGGVLARLDQRPPLFALMPPLLVVGAVLLARSRIGTLLASETPVWLLVGLQAFRLPLELVMHQAALEGVMPVQMTFGSIAGAPGFNYDIVTGGTALVLALLQRGRPTYRSLVRGWNILGSVLLLNIVAVAVVSTPLFASFGGEPSRLNTWIFFPPFVWLPAVLVGSALLGHLLLFRRMFAPFRHS